MSRLRGGCLAEPGSSGLGWRQLLKKEGTVTAAWVERWYHPDYRLCWQPPLKSWASCVIFCPFVSSPSISLFNIMVEGFLLHQRDLGLGRSCSGRQEYRFVLCILYQDASLTCRGKPCVNVSVHVVCWCLVSACTCSLLCHKSSKYSKQLFLYFVEYFCKLNGNEEENQLCTWKKSD